MRVAVVPELGHPLVIEERPVPSPGPGQVLVRLEASGLCHTDIHAAHGDWPIKPTAPFVPGHEGVGVITAVGAGVDADRVGPGSPCRGSTRRAVAASTASPAGRRCACPVEHGLQRRRLLRGVRGRRRGLRRRRSRWRRPARGGAAHVRRRDDLQGGQGVGGPPVRRRRRVRRRRSRPPRRPVRQDRRRDRRRRGRDRGQAAAGKGAGCRRHGQRASRRSCRRRSRPTSAAPTPSSRPPRRPSRCGRRSRRCVAAAGWCSSACRRTTSCACRCSRPCSAGSVSSARSSAPAAISPRCSSCTPPDAPKVVYDTRRLDQVNEAMDEVLSGAVEARLVFDLVAR